MTAPSGCVCGVVSRMQRRTVMELVPVIDSTHTSSEPICAQHGSSSMSRSTPFVIGIVVAKRDRAPTTVAVGQKSIKPTSSNCVSDTPAVNMRAWIDALFGRPHAAPTYPKSGFVARSVSTVVCPCVCTSSRYGASNAICFVIMVGGLFGSSQAGGCGSTGGTAGRSNTSSVQVRRMRFVLPSP